MKKRLLSVLLVMSLCLSLLPTTVWAWDDEEDHTNQTESSVASLTFDDSAPLFYDNLEDAIDANDDDVVGNGTITLLKDAEVEGMSTANPLTIKMEHHSIIVVDDGYFNIGGYLLLENGTIIGNVQVAAQVTATIIGAKVGVTGTVVIDEGATVTISGSEKAVGSSITYDGTLYGSADENGAAGDAAEFKNGTYYVGDGDDVARRISTKKETPAITLEKPAQPENLTVVYHDKYSSKLSLGVTFDGTVDADHPATINYYVDGATESFHSVSWTSNQNSISLDAVLTQLSAGPHTIYVTVQYQDYTARSQTYTATVVQSGISFDVFLSGSTFDYGSTFTIRAEVEPSGVSANSVSTYSDTSMGHYCVVCDASGKEITQRVVPELNSTNSKYTASLTINTRDLGAGEHQLTVKYVGCDEMESKSTTVDVTVEKSGLSVVSSADYTYNKSFTGKPIPNPTAAQLTILNSSTQERVDSASVYDKIEFEWYAATKTYDNRIGEYLYGKISDTPIDGTPIDAGDYILDVNFPETDNYCSSSSNINLTVNKTQDLGAGQSVICPVDVKLSSDEEIYTVVLADCLKNVRSGGDLAVNQYGIHFENSRFVKSAVVVNGELNITLYSLAEVKQPGQVGSITVGLSSRNYNQIPMVFNLMAQGEHLDVTMDSWTYGEDASGPEAVLPEGVTSLTITYAKADGTLLNEKPSDAGEYIVTVSCSKDGVIYSGTASFEIEPAPITADMVALEQNQLTFLPNADYSSGVEQTQGVTVTWKGQPLADANYTLTGNTATDAGTYTLTVAGTGNFTGEVKKTWTVAPLPVGFDLSGDIRKDYDGTDAADVSISDWHVEGSSDSATFQLPETLYTVTGAAYDSAEAGEGKTVRFTVTLDKNYAFSDGSHSKQFSSADFPGLTAAINKKQLAVKPDIPGTIYLPVGDNRTLSGCLSLDYFRGLYTDVKLPADAEITAVQLNEGSVSGVIDHLSVLDGMVSYDIAHNAPAGSKVNCTVTVSSENCDYIYTVSFTPVARAIPGGRPTLSRETLTYGEKLSAISLSGSMKGSDGSPVAGQFSWDYPEATPEVGSYTTNWTFTSYDDAYLPFIDGTVTITVNKITLDSTPKFTLISTSGKTLADAGLAAASDWPEGTLTWDLPLETTVAANTAYGWTFTPADTAHYETVTGTILLYSVSGGGGSGGGGGGGRPSTPAAPSTPTTPTTPDVPSATEQPFADVAPEDWFYDAVTWAKGAGITGGVSQDRFGSGDPCTRGQIVTFLWRAAGSPAPKGQVSMTDVPADAYYSTAVAWAVENGIASGTGENLFSPDAPCTRAQAVTFLWRAAGSPAAQGGADFHDVTDGDYFAQAVAWANEHDITDGVGGGLFGSMDSCTRSQIVTFLFMAR